VGIKENEDIVREYYKTADLWLPTRPNWRYFRFILFSGQTVKIIDRITNRDKLRKWLVHYAPAHVYYSCSMFLNPTIINRMYKNRTRTDILYQNLFLGSDALYFDIDKNNLDDAKKELKKLISLLKTKYYHPDHEYIYSGDRGFHLKCFGFDFKSMTSSNPVQFEKDIGEMKNLIALEIEREVDIDTPITYNTRCIIRLPGSIHGSTGNLVEIVREKDIDTYKPRQILKLSKTDESFNLSEDIKRLEKLMGV
jgi:DNA primase catalytic subunit